MFDCLSKGGILVVPILFCSVVALAIFIERFIRFYQMRKRGYGLETKVVRHLERGEDDLASKIAGSSDSPMGHVLSRAMEVKDHDRETLETVIAHATDQEITNLSRYLQALATIANITPILGLLGTVTGMIKAFMVIQEMGGKVNAAVLAGGIWEAMMTTALGLAVALPAMVGHSYLVSRVNRYEYRLQDGAITFIKAISKQKKSASDS